MTPQLLPAIAAFARVAHHGTFARAAAELGVSPSALSQTVKGLEANLGVRLLDRTTRRVGLTEIGRRFLADAAPGLASLGAAVAGIDEARDQPAGLLRLTVSRVAAQMLLVPHLSDFMNAFPDVRLEIDCEDRFVDIVAEGFDAGVRLGESLAQDMVALPLGGPQRVVTFSSPAYLTELAPPASPAELVNHRCVNLRHAGSGAIYRWEYTQDDRVFEVATQGQLVCNDLDVLLAAVRGGAGVGCAFEGAVRADFESGTLVPLLAPWWPTFPGFYLYHSSRSQIPRKLRVFTDFVRARLGNPIISSD
jgi:DNA-binding transcriptional LysR family regulator